MGGLYRECWTPRIMCGALKMGKSLRMAALKMGKFIRTAALLCRLTLPQACPAQNRRVLWRRRPQNSRMPRQWLGTCVMHGEEQVDGLDRRCAARTPTPGGSRAVAAFAHAPHPAPHQKRSRGSGSSSLGATTSRNSVWLSGSRFLASTRCRCHTSIALAHSWLGGRCTLE